jgi:hypothetical protein
LQITPQNKSLKKSDLFSSSSFINSSSLNNSDNLKGRTLLICGMIGTYPHRRTLMSLEIQGTREAKYKPIFCRG